jgi:hypothetical protein
MARVVRKSSSSKSLTKNVRSTRQPSLIREMGDADFGTLNSSKNGYVITYDSVTNDFMLMSPDDVLITSTSTPAPDEFISQLEQQLDLGTISILDIDGGGF